MSTLRAQWPNKSSGAACTLAGAFGVAGIGVTGSAAMRPVVSAPTPSAVAWSALRITDTMGPDDGGSGTAGDGESKAMLRAEERSCSTWGALQQSGMRSAGR